jgi:hypothetical protein
MIVGQGRYWRVTLSRKRESALFSVGTLPDELEELAAFKLEIPLGRWNAVMKYAESDRKLLGGILLDLAAAKEQVARVVACDRLLADLQRVLRDASVALVEAGVLVMAPPDAGTKEES